jgi:leucyl/phenylalanyl-tRNA--protein transferase
MSTTPPAFEFQMTPDLLLRAYAAGIFPMGDDRDGSIHWFAPDLRGVIPLDDRFHVPKKLARTVRRQTFAVTSDRAFGAVIRACSERMRTWITPRIIEAYEALHAEGFAHSVECWTEEDGRTLAGGLYGVALGGAFFGESMFHRATNASKVALVHLVEQMRAGGFLLLDTQYVTPHLEQFGATEVSRATYERRLMVARQMDATWWPLTDAEVVERV